MIERSADHLRVTAPMVISNASGLLAAGETILTGPEETIDLQAVTEADSSALAVMFAWIRAAEASGRKLRFVNLPPGLAALSDLYGVDEILPLG